MNPVTPMVELYALRKVEENVKGIALFTVK
jgi:hypothetical protein